MSTQTWHRQALEYIKAPASIANVTCHPLNITTLKHMLDGKSCIMYVSASAAALVTILGLWTLSDYREWCAFGTGGTPPTWKGYWRMTTIRIRRMLSLGRDSLTDHSQLSSASPRYLDDSVFPVRAGERPALMSRTMPQRQQPYPHGQIPIQVQSRVRRMISAYGSMYAELLQVEASRTEGGSTDAIYARKELDSIPARVRQDHSGLNMEVAHVHPSEGSLHVWLSEGDARTVVQSKWGVRFPLAFVDKGWTMVYAPRSMEEADVVEDIVKAAVSWVTGVNMMKV